MLTQLRILKNLNDNPLTAKLLAYYDEPSDGRANAFLAELYERGGENSLLKTLSDIVLYDENPFSRAAAEGKSNRYLKSAFIEDVKTLLNAAAKTENFNADAYFNMGEVNEHFRTSLQESANRLEGFYRQYGYGDYVRYGAFLFKNGNIEPIANAPEIRLSDLKDYAEEKSLIAANIENLLGGLPALDMLLYGERGTGKSSTVHAMANRYFGRGLRIVELHKEQLLSLPVLKEKLNAVPLKFIIYIDDLSLTEGDERFTSLKAALEGSFGVKGKNTVVCATSNRRHIVKESFSDRKDSIHENECMQEQLSLSDRFGLTVLFGTTDKKQYLSIVKQLAEDASISAAEEDLFRMAEQWALAKGGRSPRRARQFIDALYSAEQRGKPLEF
ncbi:MAG: AAA family ATPase [Bacillota bacterium]|nr:MAG: AAA family ATPase [Bacillota bacterium]